MKMTRTIEIASSVEDVWKVLGKDFVQVDAWMAGTSASEEITKGTKAQHAPVVGRRAEIAVNPGSFLNEVITGYNQKSKTLNIATTLINPQKGNPLKGYTTQITVRSLGNKSSEVVWTSQASIGLMGYVFYRPIKKGLNDGFFRGLEELKYYVETGTPHERKLAAPHCG